MDRGACWATTEQLSTHIYTTFSLFISGCPGSSLLRHRLSLVAVSRAPFIAVHGRLTVGASLVAEHGLWVSRL